MKKVSIMVFILATIVISGYFYWIVSKKAKDDKTYKETEIENLVLPDNIVINKGVIDKEIDNNKIKKVKTELDILKEGCKSGVKKGLSKKEMYFCLAQTGKWRTDDIKILKQKNINGESVAHVLARYNSNWLTEDYNILSITNSAKESVAHFLVVYNPTWVSIDDRVLSLTTDYGASVQSLQIKRKNKTKNHN